MRDKDKHWSIDSDSKEFLKPMEAYNSSFNEKTIKHNVSIELPIGVSFKLVLERLIAIADILLVKRNYDVTGWETLTFAMESAKRIKVLEPKKLSIDEIRAKFHEWYLSNAKDKYRAKAWNRNCIRR